MGDSVMTFTQWIVLLCALTLPIAVSGLAVNRLVLGRSYGVRAIQFVGASSVVPGVIILALMDKLDATTITLLGAFIGYLFYNIWRFDERS
jgi:hypothetical protein